MSAPRELRVAHEVACTEAEGPFRRYALWTRGCSLRCPGCCNPGLFAPGDATTPVSALARAIAASQRAHDVEGVTVVGGEPLEQLAALTELAQETQKLGLGVIVFTGYREEEAARLPGFSRLRAAVDTLVDGRFDARAPEPEPRAGGRRWIGSRNQRLIHYTRRYADPALWSAAAGGADVELRVLPDGAVETVGAPRLVAALARALAGR